MSGQSSNLKMSSLWQPCNFSSTPQKKRQAACHIITLNFPVLIMLEVGSPDDFLVIRHFGPVRTV